MSNATTTRQPLITRRTILDAAFHEFYRNGFQGGSLNRVVEAAGVTKGALFHHFAGKQQLGYAVVDEVIEPLLVERWLSRLDDAADPLGALQDAFRRYAREDIASGSLENGCPLNNLAQEMSPLDEGFRARTDALYDAWRGAIAEALRQGIARGVVGADVSPEGAAVLIVAAQMGMWGTGKSSRSAELMLDAAEAVCDYLERLRP